MSYDFLVFIGRFQPFHNGHLAVVRAGLAQARHVIVLVGSAHQPRSSRNPWTYAEREEMIRSAVGLAATADDARRLLIAPLMDVPYNEELWCRNVQATVAGFVTAHHGIPHQTPRIGLIGHAKDHSSYYLKLFPQWQGVDVRALAGTDGTRLRCDLFDGEELNTAAIQEGIPEGTRRFIERFVKTPIYRDVCEEHRYITAYKAQWSNAPYPPTFVTVDAVVVQSGHILLVRRRVAPGKGQSALPGGFLDPHETLEQACIRELKEETRIKVPEPVLRGSIKKVETCDYPYRSARGRTITTAFLIELTPDEQLPKVRGGDDAERAFWQPLAALNPAETFEDHYAIIQRMLGMS